MEFSHSQGWNFQFIFLKEILREPIQCKGQLYGDDEFRRKHCRDNGGTQNKNQLLLMNISNFAFYSAWCYLFPVLENS
jgi:hypothetical protein